MHAQYTLFQQGYNLLDELDPYMKKLAAEVRCCFTMWSSSATHQHKTNGFKEGGNLFPGSDFRPHVVDYRRPSNSRSANPVLPCAVDANAMYGVLVRSHWLIF